MMRFLIPILLISGLLVQIEAQISTKLELTDVFELEYVSDPQISPDGNHIVYVRNFKDIMTDRNLSNLWIVNFDGSNHHPLTTGNQNDFQPRWSPDGKKLLYKSNKDGSTQLYLRWMDSGAESKLTNLTQSFGEVTWSPSGKHLAFTMFVPESSKSLVQLPKPPAGAKWNQPPTYIDDFKYRADGSGYLKQGNQQIFVLSADGGTPRQITDAPFNHGTPQWSKDEQSLIFSANLHDNAELDPLNSEVYSISLETGEVKALTDRQGPDNNPVVSPDGSKIAYLGFDDRYQGYQVTKLYVMNADGSNARLISGDLDRDVNSIYWGADNQTLYFKYDDQGDTRLAKINLSGKKTDLTNHLGGLSLGRPYGGSSFSANPDGKYAFTYGTWESPADLAVGQNGSRKRLTELNADLFSAKKIGEVEEIWYESSHDGRKIQGWICKPPNFDANKKYPLLLEIHGGPFSNYGNRFSAEVQMYAAAGYVVLYTNPRGSTSYGEEFGNLIHHNYPGEDYDDLISGVDAVIEKGYIDEDQLYVTGGSGGGVLTAWIVGNTDRFRAAVVAKPVINWYSFVLYADNPGYFYKYWFPGKPWDHLEHYMKRSPISLAKNVTTPTMLLTGEADMRTPIPESEQYYAALKLEGVETAMVRIPGAYHGIAAKPSNLMAKVAYVLGWFEKYRNP
jgi:dipeptidyl aminopeptidase/acylaminoacyl peptidase